MDFKKISRFFNIRQNENFDDLAQMVSFFSKCVNLNQFYFNLNKKKEGSGNQSQKSFFYCLIFEVLNMDLGQHYKSNNLIRIFLSQKINR